MILKCYIVDDEEHSSQIIESYIEMTEGLELIGTEMNPLQALKNISESEIKADIIFLDIDMPRLSGIELAKLVGDRADIIFTTAFPEYAASAFEENALDYMIKPVSYVRFLKSIDRVRQKHALLKSAVKEDQNDTYFFINTNPKGKLLKIFVDEIIYVEARHNYVEIFVKDRTYLAYLTLTEVEKNLPPEKFVRLQKSYIANIEMVKSVEGNYVTMITGHTFTIGPSYRKMFHDLIDEKILKTKRNG